MKLTGRICLISLCVFALCSTLAAQQPPASPAAQPQAPAAKPQVPAVQAPVQDPENIDRMFSIGLYDWLPNGGPSLNGGVKTATPADHELGLSKRPRRAYGVVFTIPTKGSTRLEFSYLTLNDSGPAKASRDLGFFGGIVPQSEPLFTEYSLRHYKLSWNYLSYPNPPQDAKFRVKTLWEFHYMQLKPTVIETVTAPDFPLSESQKIILPAVGLGLEYVPSRHFRMEWRGSGMMLPKHSGIGDSEASMVGRLGRLEIFAGGKLLYFRTSPQQETYMRGMLWGPYGGLRWVFR